VGSHSANAPACSRSIFHEPYAKPSDTDDPRVVSSVDSMGFRTFVRIQGGGVTDLDAKWYLVSKTNLDSVIVHDADFPLRVVDV
jgi:hypothetical protein